MAECYQLYLFILPPLAFIILFQYGPMYGLQIAFKDFNGRLGIWGSPWVGMKHFARFFRDPSFSRILGNTIGLSLYEFIAGFPVPILLALSLNEVRRRGFKKTVQMVTYAPHFISVVVVVGMLYLFLNPGRGVVNHLVSAVGLTRVSFLTEPAWFKTTYVFSNIWQHAGFGSIIYMAALAGVDPQLLDAATIDGATRLQRIRHINIPVLAPTVTILLILRAGRLLQVGFEKVLLLQNPLNQSASDIIQTYVYRVGLLGGQFSYTTAIGMFNSVVNFALLVTVNEIARRTRESALW
jgi:putative aldouronate transport system permease protein